MNVSRSVTVAVFSDLIERRKPTLIFFSILTAQAMPSGSPFIPFH